MNYLLDEFVFAEQVLNNYDLYNGTDRENSFKMNLKPDFLPENQKLFALPYFLIPLDKDFILYKKEEKKFFDENLFLSKNGKIYYPFFVHPETEELFVSWLNGKYEFIDGDESIYKATPTSSYRSLLVTNTRTNVKFIAKVSLFDNVANGARHIDWSSAFGQYGSSQIVCKCVNNVENLKFFEDIAAFGITADRALLLSNRFRVLIGERRIKTLANVIRKLPEEFYTESAGKICSIASFSSPVLSKESYIYKAWKASKLNYLKFVDKYIFNPVKNILLRLFLEHGIVLESHCQNMMLELNESYLPTGKFYYRDFDITSFDRARFPFLHKKEWFEYCAMGENRTTLSSNMAMREYIGMSFLFHFIDNLIYPCVKYGVYEKIISEFKGKRFIAKKYKEMKNEILNLCPLADESFKKKNERWPYFKGTLKNISLSEIPVKLDKINEKIDLEKNYEKIIVGKPIYSGIDYYKSDCGLIVAANKENIFEIFNIKNGTKNG